MKSLLDILTKEHCAISEIRVVENKIRQIENELLRTEDKDTRDMFKGMLADHHNEKKEALDKLKDIRYEIREYFESLRDETDGPVMGYGSEILFNTREDANEVLTRICEIVNKYGLVYMSDIYELSGLESSYEDSMYGWSIDAITKFSIKRVRQGYILDLPDPNVEK